MPTTVHPKSTSAVFFLSLFPFEFSLPSLPLFFLCSPGRPQCSLGFFKRAVCQCAWPHDTHRQCVKSQASPFRFPLLSHSSPGSLPWGRCVLVKSRVSSARTRTVSVTGQVELLPLSNDPCLPSINLSRWEMAHAVQHILTHLELSCHARSARIIFLLATPVQDFRSLSYYALEENATLPLNVDGTVFYWCWCGCQVFFGVARCSSRNTSMVG